MYNKPCMNCSRIYLVKNDELLCPDCAGKVSSKPDNKPIESIKPKKTILKTKTKKKASK